MPELIDPADRPDPAERFCADLAGYLGERTGPELATLLDRPPDPVKADLISELAERGPHLVAAAAHLARPPRRRPRPAPLAARGGGRPPRRPPPPGASLEDWLAARPHGAPPATDPGRERRLGEALRGHATHRDQQNERAAPARQEPGGPSEPQPPAQGRWDWWLRDDR